MQFKAEAFTNGNKILIENLVSVPIRGIEIRKKRFLGDIVQPEEFSNNENIQVGQTANIELPADITIGDNIIIIPILLGETETQLKSYPCGIDYGIEITVN